MKKTLAIIGTLIVFIGVLLWQRPTPPFVGAVTEEKFLQDLAELQAEEVSKNGKFSRPIGRQSPYAYEVHEYISPQGPGYQVFFYRTTNGVEEFKSVGYGPEAESRTYDWQKVRNE